MLRLATLFSGIGAIEQALIQLNIDHEIVFACDNGERELSIPRESIEKEIKNMTYEEKKESYKANYKINDEDFYQDVRFLDGNKYKNKVDLLVGGSPCQSFSVNGKRGGFEDTRGTLFYEYARIINETQPKVFIFENVRGMLNHDNGKTWETIKLPL